MEAFALLNTMTLEAIEQANQREADFIAFLQDETDDWETCEHGLSAWLCAGPSHYPMEGQQW